MGQARPGSTGFRPPRLSIARLIKASGDLNPNATRVINLILVFMDSTRPLLNPCSIEARMESRCLTMLFWSFTNDGIRERRAQPTHLSKATTASA